MVGERESGFGHLASDGRKGFRELVPTNGIGFLTDPRQDNVLEPDRLGIRDDLIQVATKGVEADMSAIRPQSEITEHGPPFGCGPSIIARKLYEFEARLLQFGKGANEIGGEGIADGVKLNGKAHIAQIMASLAGSPARRDFGMAIR